jgi:hypothetical protein
MLRKLFHAGTILLFITGTAAAQSGLGGPQSNQSNQSNLSVPFKQETPPSQEEIERRKALDKEYDATIRKIPDKKSSADPWGAVRATPPATSKNKQQ